MKVVVNAIATYYHELSLADTYRNMAMVQEDTEDLLRLSKKHELLAEQTYDYIIANFQEDIARQSQTIKEHFAGAH